MEIKFGRQVGKEIKERLRSASLVVVTREKWRDLMQEQLQPREIRIFSGEITPHALVGLSQGLDHNAVVVAAGEAAVAVAGRFVAWKTGSRLVLCPLVLDHEDWFRLDVVVEEGKPEVKGEKAAELVLVDPELVWKEGETETRASVCEVLSIVPALADWRRAAAAGGEPAYDERVAEQAMDLVHEAMDWADEIAELSEAAIRRLAELLVKREELAHEFGSRLPISGAEHLFREAAKARIPRPLPAGPLLALGIVLMSEALGISSRPIRQFLSWIGVRWKPEELGLKDEEVKEVLRNLPAFACDHDSGVSFRGLDFSEEKCEALLAQAREPLIKSSLMERKK